MADHHLLAEGRVAFVGMGDGFPDVAPMAPGDPGPRPVAVMVMTALSRGRRGRGAVASVTAVTAVAGGGGRRLPMDGAMCGPGGARVVMAAAVMSARRRGRAFGHRVSGGVMVMVMDRGGGRLGQGDQAPGGESGQRAPDDDGHAEFPFIGDVRSSATHARKLSPLSCFNTMGTSPGKSSLIRPGPNASPQAA